METNNLLGTILLMLSAIYWGGIIGQISQNLERSNTWNYRLDTEWWITLIWKKVSHR